VAGSITGAAGVRRVYLTDGAVSSGFTISKGATVPGEPGGGAGAFVSVLSNCTLRRNVAGRGAGAADSDLQLCNIEINSAVLGAGVSECNVSDSVLGGNVASDMGGCV
jgi:hypothetical protein